MYLPSPGNTRQGTSIMKGKFLREKIADLKLRPLRQNHGSEEELKALARSWIKRAIHPIICRSDRTVADGHRRLAGLVLLGESDVEVFITDESLTDSQLTEVGLISALHRSDLSGFETWQAIEQLKSANPALPLKDLAALLNLDPSSVTRALSPARCSLAWQQALQAGKVNISDCYTASKVPESEQAVLLALKLAGASRDQLEAARKPRVMPTAATTAPRLSRIPVRLPGGVSVVLSGKDMTLDEAIESLSEVLKAARKARDEGLTAKSWAAGMKDKATHAKGGS